MSPPPRRSARSSSVAALQQKLGNRGLSSLLKPGPHGLHPEVLRALAGLDLPERPSSVQPVDGAPSGDELAFANEPYLTGGAVSHVAVGMQFQSRYHHQSIQPLVHPDDPDLPAVERLRVRYEAAVKAADNAELDAVVGELRTMSNIRDPEGADPNQFAIRWLIEWFAHARHLGAEDDASAMLHHIKIVSREANERPKQ